LDRFTAPEWVASVKCSRCAHMDANQVLHTKLDSSKITTSREQFDVHTIQVVTLHMLKLPKIGWLPGFYSTGPFLR